MSETTPTLIDPAPGGASPDRRRAFWLGWALVAGFMALHCTVNALSILRDDPGAGPVRPFIWEYTSGLVTICLAPAVAWLLRIAPPTRDGWLRAALVHAGGVTAFGFAHVTGFLVLRKGAYALMGARYGSADYLYEFRKEVVGYLVIVGMFWGAELAMRRIAPASTAPPRAPDAPVYALKDGARTVRAAPEEIVAVTSARNYVEFHLVDGRRPLVRDTLANVAAELASAGFVRTHRSWVVNPAHVRAVSPALAGDYRLEMACGVTAPLSRRFPQALHCLRKAA